jgi:ComF family protein
MPELLSRATRLAVDLLFPPRCALCGRDGTLLCEPCIAALPRAAGTRCERCWMPIRSAGVCRHCAEAPPSFVSLRAAFVMDGGSRRLAHELKYEGMTSLAAPMGSLMVESLGATIDSEVVVPVPLHSSRERTRGYNQAALLARQVARLAGMSLLDRAVRRTRSTTPLTKTMHREERLAIMRDAFSARRDDLAGRAILLVDDVVTTGATLDACSEALMAAGAARVDCLTWARAD